ncbi:branched-chain amino acid transport system II carrier protein [Williamwhitmania taraxaci]|nr:branched-chain amino acid transport system II carrier protein [Williamwhitmania taraxaci]
MKKSTKDIFIIGLALFAMFFGAGNLIFPPMLGFKTGESWVTGAIGFMISDIGLSLMGIVAVAILGGGFTALGNKVGPRYSKILGTTIMLTLGPLLVIPRIAAVVHEMGIAPIFSNASMWLVTGIYFTTTIFVVIDQKRVVDKLGRWLTPILLLSLFSIIIAGIMFPIGTPATAKIPNAFTLGFTEGYQTVNALAAVIFGRMILFTLVAKGYVDKAAQLRMTIKAGAFAIGLIAIIYGGLIVIGSQASAMFPEDITQTSLFVCITNSILGSWGKIIVAITIVFACFTSAAGLTATAGTYFQHISKGKIDYRISVIVMSVISFFIANLGVQKIIAISTPIIMTIYPPVIMLIICALIDKLGISKYFYRGAVHTALILSIPDLLLNFNVPVGGIVEFMNSLPLASYKIEWLIPSLLIAIVMHIAFNKKEVKIKA